ncbi:MAG: XTP/dITP diphosphatase [Candidatus Lokiarchaeota archaeon]|nr:XTP/dITP diphosphatase [Candidatus Lokiarchaeota archaeon]
MNDNKKPLYFITGNDHKFDEVYKSFREENINFDLLQSKIETLEIQANTIKEVAEFKIKSVKEIFKDSYFVEDAGFFVEDPLNGFPGVYSSYAFKTIGNDGILKMIDDYQSPRARFEAIIALYYKPTNSIHYFRGEVKGSVSKLKRGTAGFGFDPIFIPDEIPNKTFSELSTKEKNQISHRGRALAKLIEFLRTQV